MVSGVYPSSPSRYMYMRYTEVSRFDLPESFFLQVQPVFFFYLFTVHRFGVLSFDVLIRVTVSIYILVLFVLPSCSESPSARTARKRRRRRSSGRWSRGPCRDTSCSARGLAPSWPRRRDVSSCGFQGCDSAVKKSPTTLLRGGL